MTKKFTVKDTNGRVLFKSEAAETDISAKKLNIQSKRSSINDVTALDGQRFSDDRIYISIKKRDSGGVSKIIQNVVTPRP